MSNKPKCLECGANTYVLETRPGDGKPIMVYRTRKCTSKICGAVFTTVEVYAPEQTIPMKFRKPPKPEAQSD